VGHSRQQPLHTQAELGVGSIRVGSPETLLPPWAVCRVQGAVLLPSLSDDTGGLLGYCPASGELCPLPPQTSQRVLLLQGLVEAQTGRALPQPWPRPPGPQGQGSS
jgi:hypothetical protein